MDEVGPIILIVGALVGVLVFAFIGRLIGQKRGQSEGGAVMGALLGPVGLVGAAFLPDKRRQCSACKGRVPDDARKCMHCGEDMPVQPMPAVYQAPVAPAFEVTVGTWKNPVKCPTCGWTNTADEDEMAHGLKCEKCGVGFVPKPSKRK